MSVDVIKPVYKTRLGNPTAKSILARIAEHSNDVGYSFPSIKTIAEQTEYSVRQVLRVIQVLREIGLVIKIKCEAKKYKYAFQINLEMLENDLSLKFSEAFNRAQKKKCLTDSDTETQEDVSQTQKSVSETIPPHPLIGRTVKEPSRNLPAPDFILTPDGESEFPSWIPLEAWNGWLEIKKKKKSPLEGRQKAVAINKLRRWHEAGYDLTEILDAATFGNWKGLYLPKGDDGQPIKPKPKKAEAMTWDEYNEETGYHFDHDRLCWLDKNNEVV